MVIRYFNGVRAVRSFIVVAYFIMPGGMPVPKTKVAITLDAQLLDRVDELVARREFRNRSQAIESALAEKLVRARRTRLARECAKFDPEDEKALAEEGLAGFADARPEY